MTAPHAPGDPTRALPAVALSSLDTVHHTDLLSLCRGLGDASVDMILCDLPYGTTACSWDTIIPFAPMWAQFKRVIKPRGAIVLTASQPFTSTLICSNLEMFKNVWVWDKALAGNFLNMHIQPAKIHEDVCIFAEGAVNYYPQMEKGRLKVKGSNHSKPETVGKIIRHTTLNDVYYPRSIIKFSNGNRSATNLHPTQKPVALFEYLIRTYTQPGDVVLDPCVGSGTTAVACRNLDRRYICGDSSAEYVEIARKRLRDTDPFQATVLPNGAVQHSLWEGLA